LWGVAPNWRPHNSVAGIRAWTLQGHYSSAATRVMTLWLELAEALIRSPRIGVLKERG
jgi:hypothetical protein